MQWFLPLPLSRLFFVIVVTYCHRLDFIWEIASAKLAHLYYGYILLWRINNYLLTYVFVSGRSRRTCVASTRCCCWTCPAFRAGWAGPGAGLGAGPGTGWGRRVPASKSSARTTLTSGYSCCSTSRSSWLSRTSTHRWPAQRKSNNIGLMSLHFLYFYAG